MSTLNPENVADFLSRFENLDGAIIKDVRIDFQKSMAEVRLIAFDTHHEAGGDDAYCTVVLCVGRCLEFCFHQGPGESGVQLDDHLEAVWMDGLAFLIFDPLQARDYGRPEWTLEQVRRSRWYVGGGELRWQVIE